MLPGKDSLQKIPNKVCWHLADLVHCAFKRYYIDTHYCIHIHLSQKKEDISWINPNNNIIINNVPMLNHKST